MKRDDHKETSEDKSVQQRSHTSSTKKLIAARTKALAAIGTLALALAGVLLPIPAGAQTCVPDGCSSFNVLPGYQGGPVLTTPRIVDVLWSVPGTPYQDTLGPAGTSFLPEETGTAAPSAYNALTQIVAGTYFNNLSIYTPFTGLITPGKVLGPYQSPVPTITSKTVQPQDIGNQLVTDIQNHTLPAPDASTGYTVFLPIGFSLNESGYIGWSCNYQNRISYTDGSGNTQTVNFAVIPDYASIPWLSACLPHGNTQPFDTSNAFDQLTYNLSSTLADMIFNSGQSATFQDLSGNYETPGFSDQGYGADSGPGSLCKYAETANYPATTGGVSYWFSALYDPGTQGCALGTITPSATAQQTLFASSTTFTVTLKDPTATQLLTLPTSGTRFADVSFYSDGNYLGDSYVNPATGIATLTYPEKLTGTNVAVFDGYTDPNVSYNARYIPITEYAPPPPPPPPPLATTTTTVTPQSLTPLAGAPLTSTITVTSSASDAPTGSVAATDLVANQTVSLTKQTTTMSQAATSLATKFALAPYTITAQYGGDTKNLGSKATSTTINPLPGFSRFGAATTTSLTSGSRFKAVYYIAGYNNKAFSLATITALSNAHTMKVLLRHSNHTYATLDCTATTTQGFSCAGKVALAPGAYFIQPSVVLGTATLRLPMASTATNSLTLHVT